LVLRKQLAQLDKHMQAFVACAPFILLGTVDSGGNCDVSPRGELPGAVTVLDERTLVIPERPGNRRADSLRNIIQTGRVGLLFLVPGIGETLRVNGFACVMRDEDVLASMSNNGKTPVVGIGVEVEECYFQCAKALIRSRLWEARDSADFDLAQVLVEQTCIEGQTVESLKLQIESSYRDRLY
jgi:PPOX class probable FMN-dependent enzyme